MNQMTIHDGNAEAGLPAGFDAGNTSLAVSLARADVDQKIATSHAFPRSIAKAVKNIMALATMDEESAQECIYALPRGGKAIKGPSIRLAEIIAGQWGNNRNAARVVHVDRFEKYLEAEGVFHDLETNMETTARVRRSIADKYGKIFKDDMIVVAGNAACSIAKRNAILAAVPKAIWRGTYAEVERVINGDVKTLVERRSRAVASFAAYGVTPERVFAVLEVSGLEDIGIEHLSVLQGYRSAIKNNEATVEDVFPIADKPAAKSLATATTSGKLAELAKKPEAPATVPAHNPQTGEILNSGDEKPEQTVAERAPPTDAATVALSADDVLADARTAAMDGRRTFDTFFAELPPAHQDLLMPYMPELMKAAKAADGRS